MKDYKYDVFISYSRKDTAVTDRICAALDRQGILEIPNINYRFIYCGYEIKNY